MKYIIWIIGMFFLGMGLWALDDVPKSDQAYEAVQESVKKGYLSTFEGGEFMPERPVTRRELSLIIHKLEKKKTEKLWTLNQAEMQELSKLAKNFKDYLVLHETGSSVTEHQLGALSSEQMVLHYDVSQLTEDVRMLKSENKKQKQWIIGLLALSVLGVAL